MRSSISIILPTIAWCMICEARFLNCDLAGTICTADFWRAYVGNLQARCCGPFGAATGIYCDFQSSTINLVSCPSGYICNELPGFPQRAQCQRVLREGSTDPVLCSTYALVYRVTEISDSSSDSSNDCVIPMPGT
jgi:hypothetical protein